MDECGVGFFYVITIDIAFKEFLDLHDPRIELIEPRRDCCGEFGVGCHGLNAGPPVQQHVALFCGSNGRKYVTYGNASDKGAGLIERGQNLGARWGCTPDRTTENCNDATHSGKGYRVRYLLVCRSKASMRSTSPCAISWA